MTALVRHSKISLVTDGSDTSLVRPSDWNADHVITGVVETGDVPRVLTENETYYIRTDGSDSNTGLADTSGDAWATIDHAWQVISAQLDLAGFTVTIQFGDGSYSGSLFTDGSFVNGPVVIQGNTSDWTAVSCSGNFNISVRGTVTIDHITFTNSFPLFMDNRAAHLVLGSLRWIPSTGDFGIFLEMHDGSQANADFPAFYIDGTGVANIQSVFFLDTQSALSAFFFPTTVGGNVTANLGFAVADNGSYALCKSFGVSGAGTFTGRQFRGRGASVMDVDPSSFPVPGTTGLIERGAILAGWGEALATWAQNGTLTLPQVLTMSPLTFATLPSSPVAGSIAYITNSNTAVWGANAAGGGANKVMVWYNGANWTVFGA